MGLLSILASLVFRWDARKLYVSCGFPSKEMYAPRNFIGFSWILGILVSPRENWILVGLPLVIERELHLEGFSFRPSCFVRSFNWVIIFWWVDLLVVIRLKSSAKGVVITLVWLFRGNPEEVLDFRNSIIGLKAMRKISGERGSPGRLLSSWGRVRMSNQGFGFELPCCYRVLLE